MSAPTHAAESHDHGKAKGGSKSGEYINPFKVIWDTAKDIYNRPGVQKFLEGFGDMLSGVGEGLAMMIPGTTGVTKGESGGHGHKADHGHKAAH